MRALASGEEANRFRRARPAAKAAVDARLKEDGYCHLLPRATERRRPAFDLLREELANLGRLLAAQPFAHAFEHRMGAESPPFRLGVAFAEYLHEVVACR